jgi:hypothetical protein
VVGSRARLEDGVIPIERVDSALPRVRLSRVVDFVNAHGPEFISTDRDVPMGRPGWCEHNALELARVRPDLRYVEGFAHDGDWRLHCWCVDADEWVHDPTWVRDGWFYLGVRLPLELVERLQRGHTCPGFAPSEAFQITAVPTLHDEILSALGYVPPPLAQQTWEVVG